MNLPVRPCAPAGPEALSCCARKQLGEAAPDRPFAEIFPTSPAIRQRFWICLCAPKFNLAKFAEEFLKFV